MASLSSGLNPNVVKEALDKVFFQAFDQEAHPSHSTAETPQVFKQDTASNSAVIMELFKGSGYWQVRQEEQDVPQATPRVNNQVTFSVVNYANSVDITKNFFDEFHCQNKIGLNGETPTGTIPYQAFV